MSRTAAILLAAGSSRRMDGAVTDKILAPLGGKPVFAHTAATFYRSGVVDTFIVTYRDQHQMVELSAYAPTPTLFVPGGGERQDSVAAALAELPDDVGYVFIHDCARPLVRVEQLIALHKELVVSGKLSELEFHDSILKLGPIPVELIRASLLNEPLDAAFKTQWKFN